MRVFVSSSFEDLREHRAAAIRVLRQMGHEVVAMEDMVAGAALPLTKVLQMVDRCEAYVGIFAWRYGYVPAGTAGSPTPPDVPTVKGASYGATSITHYEYLRAVERGIPVMVFLLDEQCPWPPRLIDGFDREQRWSRASVEGIQELRAQLQQERVVSRFTTPSDLESRVAAAVTMAGLTRQLDLKPAASLPAGAGAPGDTSARHGIMEAIVGAGDEQRALKVDLSTTWWSTRLYLIAALAERLTQVRRILVVMGANMVGVPPALPQPMALGEEFIGQLSTHAILSAIRAPQIDKFEALVQGAPAAGPTTIRDQVMALLDLWDQAFGDLGGSHANEAAAKVDLTPELLRRWFADTLIRPAVRIDDLQRASVIDLLRLLDYPNDYVPVLTRYGPAGNVASGREQVDTIDKQALNARLAHSYLVELMDRARLV